MDTIETNSVIVPLAEGWHERHGSQQISAEGPNQELMQISVIGARSAESLDAAEKAAIAALAPTSNGMKIVMPLKSTSLENGTQLTELIFQTEDGRHFLVGIVLRGTSAVVLATIEGPSASGMVLGNARAKLLSLRWK